MQTQGYWLRHLPDAASDRRSPAAPQPTIRMHSPPLSSTVSVTPLAAPTSDPLPCKPSIPSKPTAHPLHTHGLALLAAICAYMLHAHQLRQQPQRIAPTTNLPRRHHELFLPTDTPPRYAAGDERCSCQIGGGPAETDPVRIEVRSTACQALAL
eukprot:GHVU01137836.1.p1 GENE.GHVU01137836.1~~GHVU01137836.1.p1  ORF type:complete len:154 (+),score=8.22 GHVU01137836.1:262-723(+)